MLIPEKIKAFLIATFIIGSLGGFLYFNLWWKTNHKISELERKNKLLKETSVKTVAIMMGYVDGYTAGVLGHKRYITQIGLILESSWFPSGSSNIIFPKMNYIENDSISYIKKKNIYDSRTSNYIIQYIDYKKKR